MKLKVIKGLGEGRRLGFPTINFAKPRALRLEQGVYACFMKIGGKKYKGALYYGPKYNFGISRPRLEVHLIGVCVFGRVRIAELNIVKRVRGVRKFASVSALAQQIKRDVMRIKKLLKNVELV